MSKKELENLLNKITYLTGKSQEQISIDMGYNKGYISQMFSRGKISDKFVKLLNARYVQGTQLDSANYNDATDGLRQGIVKEPEVKYEKYDIGAAVKKIEAMNEIMLSAIAELLAKANNQSSTVVKEQLQDLVNKRLNS